MTIGERFDETIIAARRGDEWALAALYSDATPVLLRYLHAREPGDADDLNSEIWISLARQLPRFEGSEREWWGLVWLVTRRALNDHWKRQRRRRTEPVATEMFAASPLQSGAGDPAEHVSQAARDAELIRLVTRSLSRDQADVILLRVVAGLNVDEVAAAIGKRPATVRVLQHRALRRLADKFAAVAHSDDAAPYATLGILPGSSFPSGSADVAGEGMT